MNVGSDPLGVAVDDCVGGISSLYQIRRVFEVGSIFELHRNVSVTGEGQKTSSVLERALSRLEIRFRQRQVPLV